MFAIVLICAMSVVPSDCTEKTALLMLRGGDANTPFACMSEGVATLARSALKPAEGEYPRFECRRKDS
jgi:hypothetical protein